MNTQIIKVKSDTNVNSAVSAIVAYLSSNKEIYIDSIGVPSNYTAIKILIWLRARLSAKGIQIAFIPFFIELETQPGMKKTGIRWQIVTLQN